MPRCLADVETGIAGEVDKKRVACFSPTCLTGLIWKFMTTRVIRPSYSFHLACASPAASRRRFSKSSIPIENGCENEKLCCKGQPEQGAELTFMPFRSSSELLLCYA